MRESRSSTISKASKRGEVLVSNVSLQRTAKSMAKSTANDTSDHNRGGLRRT
jgi:hypothetical protein